MKKAALSVLIVFLTLNLFSQSVLLQQDFESLPIGPITSTTIGDPPYIFNHPGHSGCTSTEDWSVGTSGGYGHGGSESGQYAYIEYGGMSCVQDQSLKTARFIPTQSTITVSFAWEFDDYIDSKFKVDLYNITTSTATNLVMVSADDGDDHSSSQSVTPGEEYQLHFRYTADWDYGARVDNILVTEVAPVSNFPNTADFEGVSLGSWRQSVEDNIDFTIHTGPTASSSTGPSAAFEGSYYIYVEATGNYNQTAFIDLDVDFTSLLSPGVSFAYHMYGASMGELKLQSSLDGTIWNDEWSRSGDQGTDWIQESVDLTALQGNVVKLRFHATTGASYTSDFALDDFCTNSAGSCTPLPIELISFSSKCNDDAVTCKWSTATEINTDYFLVQKTHDGEIFENAGTVQAAGNSFSRIDYSFIDYTPSIGRSYYRLKQYDIDGLSESFSLSEVECENPEVRVFQNRFSINLNFYTKKTYSVKLYDRLGRIILSKEVSSNYKISNDLVSPGVYILVIHFGQKIVYNKKAIIFN